MNILFVCTGNTCRSPMAEGYFKYLCRNVNDIQCKSAGVFAVDGSTASYNAIKVLKNRNIDISNHRSKKLDEKDILWADIIIVMSSRHKEYLSNMFKDKLKDKQVFLLNEFSKENYREDIFDPYAGDFRAYEYCFYFLKKALDCFFKYLKDK